MMYAITARLTGLFVSFLFVLTTTYAAAAQQPVSADELETPPYFSQCQNTDASTQSSCSQQQLLAYVGKHLKYPKSAKEAKAEGMMVLEFVVNKKGKVEQVKILRSSNHEALDAAALEMMAGMQKEQLWTAGRQDGKAVKAALKLPIKFKLS